MITAETRPALTPDCCEVWQFLAPSLRWFTFTDWPDLQAMPCIGEWRVNYCPACGQPRREAVMAVRS